MLASAACRPLRTRAAPGVTGRTAGQSTIVAASASTASAAHQADAGIPERLMPAFGSVAATRTAASLVPISTPAAAAAPPNSTVSASDGRATCHRVAPRALMTSRDLATTRLVARPLSSCGRPLLTCAPYRPLLPCSDAIAWLRFPARPDRSPSRIPAALGRTIQETWPTARRPGPKAPRLATAGP